MQRVISSFLLVLALTACATTHGTFHNRTKDYLTAQTIPPMITPIDSPIHGVIAYYPVPNPPKPGSITEPVSLVPPEDK